MSIHQCPKCELRFERKTELDDHCVHDHPEFRHEYPAVALAVEEEEPHGHPVPRAPVHVGLSDAVRWLSPGEH